MQTQSESAELYSARTSVLRLRVEHYLLALFGKEVISATAQDLCSALAFALREDLLLSWFVQEQSAEHVNGPVDYVIATAYSLGSQLSLALDMTHSAGPADDLLKELGSSLDIILASEFSLFDNGNSAAQATSQVFERLCSTTSGTVGFGLMPSLDAEQNVFTVRTSLASAETTYADLWRLDYPGRQQVISVGGRIEHYVDAQGRFQVNWCDTTSIVCQPSVVLVPTRVGSSPTALWLWRPDFPYALPADERLLALASHRMLQQYLLVACSLASILRTHLPVGKETWDTLPQRVTIHLVGSDTALAVAEFMRLLVDVYALSWEYAWSICQAVFRFVDHGLPPQLPIEWSTELMARLLPRHIEIVAEIDRRLRLKPPSIFKKTSGLDQSALPTVVSPDGGYIRLRSLAFLGSQTVQHIHFSAQSMPTTSLQRQLCMLWPERVQVVAPTLGQNRFRQFARPHLQHLLEVIVGTRSPDPREQLARLEELANQAHIRDVWQQSRLVNKQLVAEWAGRWLRVSLDTDSLFNLILTDQFGRSERQLLKLLHVVRLYQLAKDGPPGTVLPRTVIIASHNLGTSTYAHLVWQLLLQVADRINSDATTGNSLRILPIITPGPRLRRILYAAADLAEHIGRISRDSIDQDAMALALHGALAVATPDPVHLHLRELLGSASVFLFGMTNEELVARHLTTNSAGSKIEVNKLVQETMDILMNRVLVGRHSTLSQTLLDELTGTDPALVSAELQPYLDCQAAIERAFRNQGAWVRQSLITASRAAGFVSGM